MLRKCSERLHFFDHPDEVIENMLNSRLRCRNRIYPFSITLKNTPEPVQLEAEHTNARNPVYTFSITPTR